MDLNAVARFVYDKNELLLGVFIVLFLVTTVLLLVLSAIKEKASDSGASGGVALDPRSLNSAAFNSVIEGALKKALSDRVVAGAVATVSGEAGVSGAAAGGGEVSLQSVLADREAKIVALMADLDALKAHIETSPGGGAGVTGAAGEVSGEVDGLKARLAELQAKLSEYEIIEDDIADLSTFKEENKKMKLEIERLKAATETAKNQIDTVQATVAVEAEAAKSKIKSEVESPLKFEKSDKFELDPADDVMKEFAQAIAVQSPPTVPEAAPEPVLEASASLVVSNPDAPVQDPQAAIDALLNQVDTDKMISEAESLSDQATGSSTDDSVLEGNLDTDKLMAEMGMSEVAAPAAEVPSGPPAADDAPVNDLLAEFKDTEFGAKADGGGANSKKGV